MKKTQLIKLLCIFVICVMLFAAVSFGASAETAKSSIIHPNLQRVLEKTDPDNLLDVMIVITNDDKTIKDMPSYPDREQAQKELSEHIILNTDSFLEELSQICKYSVVYKARFVPMVDVQVQAKEIERIAELERVLMIDYVRPAGEEVYLEPDDIQSLTYCKDAFLVWVRSHEPYTTKYIDSKDSKEYEELYYHYSENDNPKQLDWVLIRANIIEIVPEAFNYYLELKERVLIELLNGAGDPRYAFPYYLYNAHTKEFYNISSIDVEDYPELEDVLADFAIGRPRGDADDDMLLTVLDATAIQKSLAFVKFLSEDDEEYRYKHQAGYRFADYDSDGVVSVLDATHIQKHLAGME